MIQNIRNIIRSSRFDSLVKTELELNEWFTPGDIDYARMAIESDFLDERALIDFSRRHNICRALDKNVGVVCAGNIPLVGFADMFYALICGCNVVVKPSHKDPLMHLFGDLERVRIVDNISQLASVDMLLVMGSNLAVESIERSFATKPALLRGERHSVAIVERELSEGEAAGLADDIFLYSGRGCRSVSHLYLPVGFDVESLRFAGRRMSDAWMDCYDYQRALASVNGREFVDGGYYILVPGQSLAIGTIGYSFYNGRRGGAGRISASGVQHIARHSNFGRAQRPSLNDFADGVNVVDFISRV